MKRRGGRQSDAIPGELRILSGDLDREGVRLAWHQFEAADVTHWSRVFDGSTLVICLNLAGRGRLRNGSSDHPVGEKAMAMCSGIGGRFEGSWDAKERHRYFAVEMRRDWLKQIAGVPPRKLRDPVHLFLNNEFRSGGAVVEQMPEDVRLLAEQMAAPPEGVADLWYRGKLLELLSYTLYEAKRTEFFCERTKRVARQRVQKVESILLADIENPPSLSELGRLAGCSPFYLSRIYRQETGITISQFLRRARLERAAELLREGDSNVTEAAMAVGYSSLSHFSKAFAEHFGCCPCVYGLKGER